MFLMSAKKKLGRCMVFYTVILAITLSGTAVWGGNFVLPYFTSLSAPDGSNPYWNGITIYNNSNTSGTAVLTFYQQDGVAGQFTTPPIPAKGMYLNLLSLIPVTKISGSGTLGGHPLFANIACNFDCGGFGMVANATTGESFDISPVVDSKSFILPYFASLSAPDGSSPFWNGITIYNNSNTSGTAVLTFYQMDGVVGQYTTPPIPAKGLYINLLSFIPVTKISGSGTLGGHPLFVNVSSNFTGGGFGMVANATTGESFSIHAKVNRSAASPSSAMMLLLDK